MTELSLPSIFAVSPHGHPTEFGRIFPPDRPWLARQPREEILFPELPIVDAHHHLWDVPGFRYLVDEFGEDVGRDHNVVATIYAECVSMYRAKGPVSMRPVGETEFVVGMHAMSASGRFGPAEIARGIIGFSDLRLGARVAEVLDAHLQAAPDLFKGVRFSTSWDASPQILSSHTGASPDAFADPAIREGARTLAAYGLSLDSWLFHTQLSDLAGLADACPDLVIVMNHCGGPLGYGPYAYDRERHFEDWRRGVLDVARRPNVVCKLGGLLGRCAAYDYVDAKDPPDSRLLAEIWRPWIETCIEAFGPARCMFESNFPVEIQGTGYSTLWNTFKRLTVGASEDERRLLFAGTAARIYRLSI
ncbi:amidohydrolase family protein [Bradyrhizobium sp. BR 10289]|uniref:amidohydrolase family protein n=1 Tax=Bradyrhizobium sp. BR 10289 TaxID=2749993 RepID=UPI001C65196B|nr:amidohydrolase family protein [Bradyrhizobium sp. BR 10289]MBW7970250.1 amidohydrolase family protein [Bradyrhizobium sp. BR 10289]